MHPPISNLTDLNEKERKWLCNSIWHLPPCYISNFHSPTWTITQPHSPNHTTNLMFGTLFKIFCWIWIEAWNSLQNPMHHKKQKIITKNQHKLYMPPPRFFFTSPFRFNRDQQTCELKRPATSNTKQQLHDTIIIKKCHAFLKIINFPNNSYDKS